VVGVAHKEEPYQVLVITIVLQQQFDTVFYFKTGRILYARLK